MKKTLLLFLLLPFFGFAQTDLARWNAATSSLYTPAVAANVTPLDITTNGGVSITHVSYNSESTFFQTGNWPVPQQIGSAYDVNKYIQFRIKPADKYKIDVNTFTFQCRSGSGKFKVRYSKNANFETGVKDLILETTTPGNWTTYTTALSPDFNPILENEYIYIRIYSYSTNNTFEIKTGTLSTNVVPVINGSVSPYDSSKIMAVKDFADTKINVAANINLLANDIQKQNVTTLTLSTPPNALEGTAIINPDKSITFNPAKDFVGTSTFSYTISNGTETSTSTVKVTVSGNPDNVLSLWNGAGDSFNPVTNSYVNSNSPVTSVGATLKYTFYNTDNAFFETGNWPRPEQNGGKEDPGKYVQFKINPDSKHKLTLKQFNFTYRANGQRFLVKYSKDPNFTAGVLTMIPDTPTASNWTSLTNNINPSVNPILPNETLYIRIYSYSSNNNFEIKNGNGNSEGPVITGTVDDVYTLTANNDYVSTPSNKPIEIDVLANDVVGSTYPLNSISFTQPSNGTVTIDATNKITFTPNANFTGSATFTYTLRNTNSPSDYSSATVIVNATAPVCITPGDQTAFGSDAWIGYVYKMADNAAMPPNVSYPALPNTTIATYIGTVTENKNFDRNVGEGAVAGATTNIPCVTAPADRFFVRYKMLATITEAGVYSFDLGSDDGVRLYIDDVATPVISRWNGRGYTTDYVSQNLSVGTHKFVLEYYEDGGASRVSFFYGLPKGNPTEYGNKVWNVYGYVNNDITLNNVRYAGYYVDPNLSPDSANFWSRDKSPSSATIWQGSQIPDNNFTVVYKRKGFDCGLYQLRHLNHDDAYELYIDDVLIASQNGWNNASFLINGGQLYPLNNNSRVEIRLREDGGDANLSINFTKTDVIYNGTGTIPSGGSVVINNNTVLSSDLTVCSCTVNPNVTLTVPKDVTLTVDENINVGAGGKLLVQSGGSLLQTSTDKNMFKGAKEAFEAQRTTNVSRFDITFWSSPVADFSMNDLSPDTLYDKFAIWDTTTSKWATIINGLKNMDPGIGYNIRAPQSHDVNQPKDFTAKFKGIPNNGDVEVKLASGKFNLVGNPYPSAIDAEQFIADNGDVGALYFWSHNTPPKIIEGTNTYRYSSSDYAVLSMLGETTPSPKGQSPDRHIGTGQGFFILPSVNSILFKNSQRMKANNTSFFKTTSKNNTIEKNRLWLNLSNNEDAFKQMLIGYATGATNSWDYNYDAVTMASNSFVDFYSINESKRLTIQGRALPFDNTDTIPLGYKSTFAGELTISIDHADGFFDTQEIYLEDKLTGKIIDLRKENYTFKTAIGTASSRFVLRFTNKTLGTDDFENIGNNVLVSVKSKVISLTSGTENIKEAQIYTIGGQSIYSKNKIDAKELEIANLHSSNQVLLVKVILENGHTVTKKIIFN